MSLSDLTGKVKVHVREFVEIDVSEYLELEEGAEPVRVVIGEPYAYNLTLAAQRGREVRKQHPLLDEESALQCVLLGSCHQSPPSKEESAEGKLRDQIAFYTALAVNNPPAFLRVCTEFRVRFRWLQDMIAAAQEKKDE